MRLKTIDTTSTTVSTPTSLWNHAKSLDAAKKQREDTLAASQQSLVRQREKENAAKKVELAAQVAAHELAKATEVAAAVTDAEAARLMVRQASLDNVHGVPQSVNLEAQQAEISTLEAEFGSSGGSFLE